MKSIKWLAPFTQKGSNEQAKVEIKILNKDGEYERKFFVFDTGNTKTCISKQDLYDMGYHLETYDAMKTVVSTSSLADGTEMDNGAITAKKCFNRKFILRRVHI